MLEIRSEVVACWAGEQVGWGQVFREMEHLISTLQGFKFLFLGREANIASHLCAKHYYPWLMW